MSPLRVPDDLWEAIEPLLPREPPKPKGGHPRIPDRAVLGGIIFVLRTGTPWRLLPKELGCGSGPTCWRRLRDWQRAGVWEALHRRLGVRYERCAELLRGLLHLACALICMRFLTSADEESYGRH